MHDNKQNAKVVIAIVMYPYYSINKHYDKLLAS